MSIRMRIYRVRRLETWEVLGCLRERLLGTLIGGLRTSNAAASAEPTGDLQLARSLPVMLVFSPQGRRANQSNERLSMRGLTASRSCKLT